MWQAAALGALHGPAELLPVSSSGHIAVVPWLAGWSYRELDHDLRKSFEVALHTGTAAALLISLRGEVEEAVRGLSLRRLVLIGLSFAPAAVIGYRFERPIEQHFGTPPTVAGGLFVGAVAMALSDRSPQERDLRGVGLLGRAVAGTRPGVLARARRLAQRGDAGRGAVAAVHPGRRESALAPCRAADHRRRDACSRACGCARGGCRRAPPCRSRPARQPRSSRRLLPHV